MVNSAISVSAYAKINLHLEVLNKRVDGFHNIASVFQPISLCDELLIEETPNSSKCNVFSPLFDLPEENTITKAYSEFAEFTGVTSAVNVKLIKNIPVGAGLGGGSSDAAALLLALNGIFNTKLSSEELKNIALKVGSDVPFFIENRTSIVTGRGEIIKPFPLQPSYFGVLVFPEIHSSSKTAYSLLKKTEQDKTGSTIDLENYYCQDCCDWAFFNSFEEVLFEEYPKIKKLKQDILLNGADFALMSGAGSSVFGLFKDEKHAKRAYFELLRQYKSVFLFFCLRFL